MPDANLVVVRGFLSQTEADLAKGALEAAGIDALIKSDSTGGVTPHLAFASGGFKLLVREEDEAAARDVLEIPARDLG